MDRDFKVNARLLLADGNTIATNMLPPHLYYVAAALPRIEQKRKRQPRSRPDWVAPFECRNIVLGPAMERWDFTNLVSTPLPCKSNGN
jgi:hypothetical protein